ncbi:MAG: type II toxin-antitoxin system VapC family toxin [Mycobacterium sp.]
MTGDGPRRGILDTSTVILLGDITDPTALPDESVISAITLAELSVGPHVAHGDDERGARQQHLQQAEADFEVLPFDADCARAFGGVAAALRASGRKPAARAYDALIAASAIAHGVALYTCNPDDFRGIPRLELHPIAHPDHR